MNRFSEWTPRHTRRAMLMGGVLVVTLSLVACGLGLDGDDSAHQSPVSEMISSHDEALIPVAQHAERRELEKPGIPDRVGTPEKWQGSKYEFGQDGEREPGEADGDDPILVRETGFRPAEGDDVIEVRETGFLGRPDLRLAGMDGDTGLIEWNPVAGAHAYEISGTRYEVEGVALESFTEDVSNTRARIRTGGFYTRVRVVAVARDGLDRSKPSNEVEIFPSPRN